MRKLIDIKAIVIAVLVFTTTLLSCGKLEDINTDPNKLKETNPGSMLDPILYELGRTNWTRYCYFTASLMQFTASTGSGGVSRYEFSESAGDGSWDTYYIWLANIKHMEKLAIESNNTNYQAVAKVLKCWITQILTDCFGDIPYEEAGRGDEGIFQPKFDTQLSVYTNLISELEAANELFDTEAGLVYNTSGEIMYGSSTTVDCAKWQKFCNSLLMRILLRTSNVAGLNSTSKLEDMIANPDKYPIFESNDDGAMIAISGNFPLEVPIPRIRDYELTGSASKFYIDNLESWNDPRLPLYYNKTEAGTYNGIQSGDESAPAGFTASALNTIIASAPMKFVLMSYAEVEFIKAEVAFNNGDHAAAKTAYENGVAASIEQWTGSQIATDYFNNPLAAYNNTFERIMVQKYHALLYSDYQQWFEYQRTGLPVLPRGNGIYINDNMPNRFLYPAALQRTNKTNYDAAVSNMGGDTFFTKHIWQK